MGRVFILHTNLDKEVDVPRGLAAILTCRLGPAAA